MEDKLAAESEEQMTEQHTYTPPWVREFTSIYTTILIILLTILTIALISFVGYSLHQDTPMIRQITINAKASAEAHHTKVITLEVIEEGQYSSARFLNVIIKIPSPSGAKPSAMET
jgi:hypothetical protein